MEMNKLPVIGGALALLLGLAYSSLFVVSPKEQAIVLRFGEITRVISEPGLYFKIPTAVVDSVQYVEKRVQRFELDDIRVQVRMVGVTLWMHSWPIALLTRESSVKRLPVRLNC